jgi:hypothetical protein
MFTALQIQLLNLKQKTQGSPSKQRDMLSHFMSRKTKSPLFWNKTPHGPAKVNVSEEHIATIFRVEE